MLVVLVFHLCVEGLSLYSVACLLVLVGRALVCLPGPLWAGPFWVPSGPLWARLLWNFPSSVRGHVATPTHRTHPAFVYPAIIDIGCVRGGTFNSSRLFVWAIRMLGKSEICFMQNYKDGGWTVMTRNDRKQLHTEVLTHGNYTLWGSVGSDVMKRSYDFARRIGDFEGNSQWLSLARKSLENSTLVSKLKLLLKSHKDNGSVACRAIHANPTFSFEMHSRWVMGKLRGVLRTQRHLVNSSEVVVKDLSKVMCKIDIKDFYVVGKSHIIAEQVSSLFRDDSALMGLIFNVVFFLLENQYVQHEDLVYKVHDGTGIGLLHSGDVADACYLPLVELKLAGLYERSRLPIGADFAMTCFFWRRTSGCSRIFLRRC